MPIHSRASIRYARALLLAAGEAARFEELKGEVQGMRDLVAETPALQAFLADPSIAMQNKLTIMERIFKERVSPLMWRFLDLLVRKHREGMLADILAAAQTLIDEHEGRAEADVASAVPLDDRQEAHLREQLARATGKQVVMTVRHDPSLVAGFIARVGDTVYDASLAAQLRRLRQRLTEADIRAAVHEH